MFPYQPSDLAALLANPLIRDVLHQLSLSQLQQPAQPQPRFQNPPPMNAGFASNPILNKNHNSPPSQAPSNLLSQSRDEYYRQTYYNGNQFDQQQPMTLEIDSGNDEFFQKPFFQDLPQNLYSDPQLSSADAASQEIWSNDYQNTECLGCLTPDSLPSTLQRPDSGYPPSSDDSSIEHFEPTNGSNHSPAAVKKPCEKYIRPMFLTSKEYEEMRRDFESNGTNVLDKDDHTWQSTWQKKPPPRINEPVEFPPLNLSNDDKLSHSWKVSENFAKSSNRNLQKPQNIFNGWGLKLEKNPFESVSLKLEGKFLLD